MEFISIISALGGLLGFIVWDRRRMESRIERRPIAILSDALWSARLLCRSLVGFAVVFALLGLVEFSNHGSPPFSGRGRFLKLLAHEIFGSIGPSLLYFAFAVVLVVAARAEWRRAPRRPVDSLFW